MSIRRINFPRYISSQRIRKSFKNLPFTLNIRNIDVNGQKRGCSGFITNDKTNKICYITTEPFFDGSSGSGLFCDKDRAIMMRTAESTKDFTGGKNHWLPANENAIIKMAGLLTE